MISCTNTKYIPVNMFTCIDVRTLVCVYMMFCMSNKLNYTISMVTIKSVKIRI